MAQTTITITADNPIDLKAKIKTVETIAALDTETLNKLGQLANSKKAIDKLKNNWLIIKQMVL